MTISTRSQQCPLEGDTRGDGEHGRCAAESPARPEVAAYLDSRRRCLGLPQLSVRILDGDASIATYDSPGALRESASYRVGSLTKVVTAITVLSLQQEGALRLADAVSLHLPWFAGCERSAAEGPVRVIDLLLHTGGLARGAFHPTNPSVDELRRSLTKSASSAGRGTFKYSNLGYTLLGALIEQASGDSYPAVVQRTVFAPFRMARSGFRDPPAELRMTTPHRLRYFLEDNRSPYDQEAMLPLSGPFASHGMYSTPADFCELVRRLLDVVGREGAQARAGDVGTTLLTLRHPIRRRLEAGCGFYFADTAHGEALFENAEHFGHSASMYLVPRRRFAVIAMTNRGSAGRDLASIVEALVRYHLSGSGQAALRRHYEDPSSVVGDYIDERGSHLTVVGEETSLSASIDGAERRPLIHVGRGCFLMTGGAYARYVLRLDRDRAGVRGLCLGPFYYARGRGEPRIPAAARHDDVVGIYRNPSVGRVALFERNAELVLAFSPFKEAILERVGHDLFVQKDGPFAHERVRFAGDGRSLTLGDLQFEKTNARY